MTKLAIVGEFWGEAEEHLRHPFVGTSGVELLRMLDESGILTLTRSDQDCINDYWRYRDGNYTKLIWRAHPEVRVFSTLNLRPPSGKIENLCGPKKEDTTGLPPIAGGKYLRAEFLPHVEKLYSDLAALQPNLVLALGNAPCWALLRRTAITRIRGGVTQSVAGPRLKVLPAISPSAILRQWEHRHVTVLDFLKAKRELEFPEVRRPFREVWTEPSLADLDGFYERYIAGANFIAPDIETYGNAITCIGFSPQPNVSIVVPFYDPRRSDGNYWQTAQEERLAWEWVRKVLDHPAPKVFQNGLYDIHFLWRGYGLKTRNAGHDTMLLHHALHPESQKGLGFLGSVYTDEASWKVTMRDRTAKNQTLKRDDE